MYDPNMPAPGPGQMQITSFPQTLGGVPARGLPAPNGFPAQQPRQPVPGAPMGGGNALANMPNMSQYFPGGLPGGFNLPPGIGIPQGTQPAPGSLPPAGGSLPGNMGNPGGFNPQGLMAALRGWLDARPSWQGYDGNRQEFMDARQDWRGQMPNFRSFIQGAPSSASPMSAPNILPGA